MTNQNGNDRNNGYDREKVIAEIHELEGLLQRGLPKWVIDGDWDDYKRWIESLAGEPRNLATG